jgi:hypothetical protein
MEIDDMPEDVRNHPSRSGGLSPYSKNVLIAFFTGVAFAVIVWLIFDGPWSEHTQNPKGSDNSPVNVTNEQSRSHGEDLKEEAQRLAGVNFYNTETPTSKLARLYADALSKSVEDKDPKACQTGLQNFRQQLNKMPLEVIIGLHEENAERDWQVPTSDTFLDTQHLKYACKQAAKLDLMSDLKLSSSGHQALDAINSDDVILLRKDNPEAPKVCFDILSQDYRQALGRATAADRVMLGLTSLVLPEELSDAQFAVLCDYEPNNKA